MKPEELIQETEKGLTKWEGYLFAKLTALGSKSEGPLYALQLEDGKELPIQKKVLPWMEDPVLQTCLGERVTVYGTLRDSEAGINYEKLVRPKGPLNLDIKLDLTDNTLWINKMPGPAPDFPPTMKEVQVGFAVQWPYRSIWEGECPSTQLYDIWIEDPCNRMVWKWSRSLRFLDEVTPVELPGGSPKIVSVPWHYFDDAITQEGTYVVAAKFIASGQIVRKAFSVQFAH